MTIWQRFLCWLRLRQETDARTFELNEDLQGILSALAERTGRPERELAKEVFVFGLEHYYTQNTTWKNWQSLTPRERDVVALTCLGYTNRQMAATLGISVETVKTHLANALRKFNLRSKADLRVVLADWDFSAWLK
jgi:DNA-binding CsgD family transcriptional regulator